MGWLCSIAWCGNISRSVCNFFVFIDALKEFERAGLEGEWSGGLESV